MSDIPTVKQCKKLKEWGYPQDVFAIPTVKGLMEWMGDKYERDIYLRIITSIGWDAYTLDIDKRYSDVFDTAIEALLDLAEKLEVGK